MALVALGVIALESLHPNTNNFASAMATLFMNVAILGPIFWVPSLRMDVATVRRLFLVYWVFSTMSAMLGVLQLYFPGRFDPAVSSVFSDKYINALHITLQSGERVFRPMGLTDTPGGAGIGAAYCILFAVGFLLDKPSLLFRAVLLASIGAACFVLYICQVRVVLVMTVIGLIAMSLPFAIQGRLNRYLAMATVLLGLATVGFVEAVAVGGQSVTGRMASLTDNDVGTVFYKNRGGFLNDTFTNLIPKYPLGAGLGRWGMTAIYFADPSNTDGRALWAEIQWTAWLYDGGILLMCVYTLALLIAWREAVRAAAKPNDAVGRDVYKWATVLFGYSIATVALTFDTAPFNGTMGVDFWVLNAAVFAAARQLNS
jgi:hypothetical protein